MNRRTQIALRVGAVALVAVSALVIWRHQSDTRHLAILRADPETLLTDPLLRATALADGRKVFIRHCSACHGPQGKADQAKAIPDLTDKKFLFDQGTVGQIEQIVLHGIRAGDTKGWNLAEMPGFAQAVPYRKEPLPPLDPRQISDLVGFLRAANGHGGYELARIERGGKLFATSAGCWDCHGNDGAGDPAIGAPNLVDGLWLKGKGSEADLTDIIERGMAGVSPAFQRRMSAYEARVVAAYTASLHPILPSILR